MQLIKTIPLNYGNSVIAQWEQECAAIEDHNNKVNQQLSLVEGWEAQEIFNNGQLSKTVVNIVPGNNQCWALRIEASDLPKEGTSTVTSRWGCKFVVTKKLVNVNNNKEKLKEFPEKPKVNILNAGTAFDEILKVQPALKIQAYDLLKDREQGFYYTAWVYPKVTKFEVYHDHDWESGAWSNVLFYRTKHIYRVYPDRLEVWETESRNMTVYKEGGSGGSSESEVGIGSWSDKGYF